MLRRIIYIYLAEQTSACSVWAKTTGWECLSTASNSQLRNGVTQEAKYEESWPNTASAWASWRRFDIPVDRYDWVHSLLRCTGVSYLLLGNPAGKYLLSKISKSGQGQHSVYSVGVTVLYSTLHWWMLSWRISIMYFTTKLEYIKTVVFMV